MRKIGLLLLVALLLAAVALPLTGCGLFKNITVEEAKENLENAGYEVTVMSGKDYVESEDAYLFILEHELDNYLYAVKGDDVIHMYFFSTIDDASDNYGFMNDSKLLGGQKNNVVYFATKQARKDAKV